MIKVKKKIAFLGNQMAPGGGAMSLYLLVKSLNSNLYDKFVYVSHCRSEEMKKDIQQYCQEIRVIELKEITSCQTSNSSYLQYLKHKLSSPKYCKDFLAFLIEQDIEILHINNSVFALVYKWVKKYTDIKIVTHVREMIHHAGIGQIQKFMIEQIYKYSDAIISISDNEAIPFKGHPNLHIIPNPFDFSKVDKINANFRKNNGIDEETILIAMLGHFARDKGHLLFLNALKELLDLKKQNKQFIFVIIGANLTRKPKWKILAKKVLLKKDYQIEVVNYIEKNNISDYVISIPYHYHVLRVLKAMDIIVRPSLSGDPWGRDIIESMALRKPIIATGSSEFYVEDGKTGYLVPPANSQKMAEKIDDLINNPEKRRRFGEAGYEKVFKKCNLNTYGDKISDIYNAVIL